MNVNAVSKNKITATVVLSLILAWLYTSIPWEQLNGLGFPDVENYLARISEFERGAGILYEDEPSLVTFVFRETLWGYLLGVAALLGIGGTILQTVGLVSAATCWFFVATRSNVFLATFVLLNPLMIDLFNGQVRSALAVALLILAVLSNSKFFKALLAGCAIFVHIASLIFIPLFLFCLYLSKKGNLKPFWSKVIAASVGMFLAVGIVYGREVLLLAVSDRRLERDEGTSSLLYALPWLAIASLILVGNIKRDLHRWIPLLGIASISLFFAMTVLGVYSSRFLAIGLPAIALALWYLHGHLRIIAMTCFVGLQTVQLFYWFRL
jgi:hypothetical protein